MAHYEYLTMDDVIVITAIIKALQEKGVAKIAYRDPYDEYEDEVFDAADIEGYLQNADGKLEDFGLIPQDENGEDIGWFFIVTGNDWFQLTDWGYNELDEYVAHRYEEIAEAEAARRGLRPKF